MLPRQLTGSQAGKYALGARSLLAAASILLMAQPADGRALAADTAILTPRRTQAERRAGTRRALLDATLEVLDEVGYARLTTAQVVARAGVTRGAQAHYFATKADLVVQALKHLTDQMVAELVAFPVRDAGGLLEQYELLLNRLWELHAGTGSTALIELFVASRTDPELREALQDFDHAVAQTLQVTAETVAPELVARPDFRSLMVTAIATIRGLWLLRAVANERQVRRLWPQARAQLTAGAPFDTEPG
jgi:AcrR family transcriptional regulator